MAYEIVRTKSIKATASLASSQFCFVKLDTNGQIVLCTAGAYSVGVLQDKPGIGDPGSVCFPGDITKVLCAGNINAGQNVASDGVGKAVAAASGNYILGQALQAGAAGAVISIIYQPGGAKL